MTTIATLFSGGEGVGVGARMAGLSHLWGVEYDDAIASVARLNGFNTLTGDVRDRDLMRSLPRPDVLHASPVCKNASNAKADGEESPLDIETADATCAYIEHFKPDVFTLENVWGYRTFEAFAHILICLKRNGYKVDYWHLNAADYGIMYLCPIHDTNYQNEIARCAESNYHREIAPDIAKVLAMMSRDDQAMHLANDAAVNLVKAIQRDTVASAAWRWLASADKLEILTRIGRAEELLMSADTSKLELTEGIDANTASLLNACLDATLIRERWYITETATLKIMLLKILKSLTATVTTRDYTTNSDRSQEVGRLAIDGDCPLCGMKGVPQTRKRLILVAALHFKPIKPLATHARPDKLTPMFDTRKPWVGWYESIVDLIDTLPESKFAAWQLERLPQELAGTFLSDMQNIGRDLSTQETDEPFTTVTATMMRRPIAEPKAFIVNNQASDDHHGGTYGVTAREGRDPSVVITNGFIPKAFIVNGTPNDNGASVTACAQDDPSFTMTGSMDKRPARAFIVSQEYANSNASEERGLQMRDEVQPATTVKANGTNGIPTAFIMPNANTSSGVIRDGNEPAPTQGNVERVGNQPRAFVMNEGNPNGHEYKKYRDDVEPIKTVTAGAMVTRAWLSSGRVVKMTPRALARFQSIPDSYTLPDKAKLACTVIGNSVPPLLYQRIAESYQRQMSRLP